jgi:acid phosphatase type 7
MRYLAQCLITLVLITSSTLSYAQCNGPTPMLCDADGNSEINAADITLISEAKGDPASPHPGDVKDADMDGTITVLDARKCATMCSSAECADALAACVGTEIQPERLFLQQLGPDSVIIKWRGNQAPDGAEGSNLCFGTDKDNLLRSSKTWAAVTATEHREVLLSGLDPDTTYYYSVGGAGVAAPEHSFRTAPATGSVPVDGNTRIWLVGDSGTGGNDEPTHVGEAAAVLAGMETYIANDGEDVDVFLMLGDNAYTHGTDFNYQQAVFETYPELLRNVPVWPTIGNHEMGSAGLSTSSDPDSYAGAGGGAQGGMPYLDIFSLPTSGEAGGVASGTEQYYSFDYGNVHIVSLDSQLSARDDLQRAAMRSWLIDDLSANDSDWTVVIFHHPPYSKGSNHDSDVDRLGVDRPQKDMREEFVEVFDDYGVDLVYSGHSHSYERSYYLRNHTGLSNTFTTAAPQLHAELVGGIPGNPPASGRIADGQSYSQLSPTSGGVDDRVVYTVAGSSGKADSSAGFFTPPAEWLRHAAHIEQPADTVAPKRRGLNVLGSVLVDASGTSMTASFIDVDGVVLDSFTINR